MSSLLQKQFYFLDKNFQQRPDLPFLSGWKDAELGRKKLMKCYRVMFYAIILTKSSGIQISLLACPPPPFHFMIYGAINIFLCQLGKKCYTLTCTGLSTMDCLIVFSVVK